MSVGTSIGKHCKRKLKRHENRKNGGGRFQEKEREKFRKRECKI